LLHLTGTRLREIFGPQHPDTLVCEANRAVTLHKAGQENQATKLREQLLTDFNRQLGEHHPDTLRLREWRYSDRELEPEPT
jgi:hypothetical protein